MAPKPDLKSEKLEKQMQEISKLQTSDVVIQARDSAMLKEAPTNFYQYERDFKSFKNDKTKKLQYIQNIKAVHVATIFKSDLEADVMLDIFETFLEQDAAYFKANSAYLVDFVHAIQQVKPFELSCDFLMDDEKDKIKSFVQKLDSTCEDDNATMIKIK